LAEAIAQGVFPFRLGVSPIEPSRAKKDMRFENLVFSNLSIRSPHQDSWAVRLQLRGVYLGTESIAV
jgi:hypothetical protein